ncbi:MAG: tyrosine-type recombinase/integrase, partial [Rhodomicrobium sp.]
MPRKCEPMTAPASRRKGKSAAETGPEAHDLASRPKDFLTRGEVRALLAAAKDGRHGARDHLLLTMIFQHALRAIEACRLRVDQVDLEAARVWVDRVKGGRSTHQPLTGDEVRMIRAYLRDRKFDTPWLFAGERGDQLSRHAVQYIVRQAATRAKLSAHPHTLRHSCGYYLADRGTEFRTMQD